MAERYSPAGLIEFLSVLRTRYANGVGMVYGNAPRPSSPRLAPTGILMGKITLGGLAFTPGSPTNGLNFAAPSLVSNVATMTKEPLEDWRFKCDAVGTITYVRLLTNAADAAGISDVDHRIDLTVGTSGAQIIIPKVVYTVIGEFASVSSWKIEYTNFD